MSELQSSSSFEPVIFFLSVSLSSFLVMVFLLFAFLWLQKDMNNIGGEKKESIMNNDDESAFSQYKFTCILLNWAGIGWVLQFQADSVSCLICVSC